jgi:hypothetical protein
LSSQFGVAVIQKGLDKEDAERTRLQD